MSAALLIVATLSSIATAQRTDDARQTIVITGTPLADTEARLAACLRRKCPPKEDIDTSLAHAENQFLFGDYAGARTTLFKARGRNMRFAASLPVDVADLNRAYGRLANVMGQPESSRLAQITALDTLKAGLDDGDSRILLQRLMVGDEFAREGRLVAAEDVYRKVAKQARKSGNLRVFGHALFHDAVLSGALAGAWKQYRPLAKNKIAKIERTTEPELADVRDAAKILRASVTALEGDKGALDRAIAAIPARTGYPILVYSPPLDIEKIAAAPSMRGVVNDGGSQWIDFRISIQADGRVSALEQLRQSENVATDWPRVVQQVLVRRRYAPLLLPAGVESVSRVERFSFVRDWVHDTGTRFKVQKGKGRITSFDLTADPSSPPAAVES